jgi:hypothetical protein
MLALAKCHSFVIKTVFLDLTSALRERNSETAVEAALWEGK